MTFQIPMQVIEPPEPVITGDDQEWEVDRIAGAFRTDSRAALDMSQHPFSNDCIRARGQRIIPPGSHFTPDDYSH